MKPKKSLGQNFLTNKKAIFEIVKAGDIEERDTILEIGPGKGALTEELLKSSAKKIIAIEKDKKLIPFLTEKFIEEIKTSRLILIEGDILDFEIEKLFKKDSYKLIANIPYYITGMIIEKFLSATKKPEKLVLLVQKEVAERIVARDKKESILSLAVKFYGNPKIIYKVSAGSFFPKPKVDSAVLKIETDNNVVFKKEFEERYFKLIKKSFSHKRKVMLNNLKKEYSEQDWDKIFEKLGLDKKVRAEDLEIESFLNITKELI
ncbi:Ribosomal RNA small subunit methyltransferase A [bioreactor metagenome]|uniref:Ribosomal RNA small subunit methyltransferase A n=1 Tax=bioreactor metagenome TaxID=1076179 RepID=A0A644UA84_9ZZZZ|nr:16S rRNA (adenine(1518)-N(6)/adenine(1519)-N(6))-dimethyltransferase RsmA [Candidatus Elulimicrobiales bacterium]